MKKLFTSVLAIGLIVHVNAQSSTSSESSSGGSLIKKAGGLLDKVKKKTGSDGLSNDDIVAGLKEALSVGAKNSSDKLSAVDGFFKDAAIKILMPEEARKVEQKLRQLGMGKLVDNAILSMNRAAEDAAKSAAPIFIDAVKNMSIQDAWGILKGTDTAATAYLRKATSNPLTAAFQPVINASLEKTDATKYWKEVFDVYNKFSLKPVNSDLSAYVTERAMTGIFYYVAEEEKKIRTNPAARVSDILQKVFGAR
ncbi:DUF4197 domain-containing protein [Flavihumibacter rivuli]|uniref:DUF4197 domain-containing protein n=1 Tax=Flavihumibacter rivuli TaxID=2838156 RepID=UPI001BDEE22B|nr:DUF4197 domain-containing protein [Flavihumibacter rivuli]ULQ57321.1 DUF4197 domain-containing protein [Flavihumibacter rivuli]